MTENRVSRGSGPTQPWMPLPNLWTLARLQGPVGLLPCHHRLGALGSPGAPRGTWAPPAQGHLRRPPLRALCHLPCAQSRHVPARWHLFREGKTGPLEHWPPPPGRPRGVAARAVPDHGQRRVSGHELGAHELCVARAVPRVPVPAALGHGGYSRQWVQQVCCATQCRVFTAGARAPTGRTDGPGRGPPALPHQPPPPCSSSNVRGRCGQCSLHARAEQAGDGLRGSVTHPVLGTV